MASPITYYLHTFKTEVYALFYALPFIEVCLGITLLVPRLRKFAVWIVIPLKLGFLLLLGPVGHNINTVIWPWIIALMLIVWLVSIDPPSSTIRLPYKYAPLQILLILTVCALPALKYTGFYPKGFAFELYSGTNTVYDRPLEASRCRIPAQADAFVYLYEGKYRIKMYDFSMSELNLPPNADPYYLKRFDETLQNEWCSGKQ
jgi:hypothetical protein